MQHFSVIGHGLNMFSYRPWSQHVQVEIRGAYDTKITECYSKRHFLQAVIKKILWLVQLYANQQT